MHGQLFKHPLNQKLTASTGKTGCGKSTVLDIIKLASDLDPQIVFIDMSSVIRWHKAQKTEIGKMYEGLGDLELKGELYPAKPVIGGFIEYFRAVYDSKEVKFICAAGLPRHPEQTELMHTKSFRKWRLVHIEISDPLLYRILRQRNRPDDTPEAVEKKIDIYRNFVRPCVDLAVEKYRVPTLWINRKQPLRIKVQKFVEFTDWDPQLKERILRNCRNKDHSAYKMIRELDGADQAARNQSLENGNPLFETSNVSVGKEQSAPDPQPEPVAQTAERPEWTGYHMAFPPRDNGDRPLIPAGSNHRTPMRVSNR